MMKNIEIGETLVAYIWHCNSRYSCRIYNIKSIREKMLEITLNLQSRILKLSKLRSHCRTIKCNVLCAIDKTLTLFQFSKQCFVVHAPQNNALLCTSTKKTQRHCHHVAC